MMIIMMNGWMYVSISLILDHCSELLHNVTPSVLHVVRVGRRFCLGNMHINILTQILSGYYAYKYFDFITGCKLTLETSSASCFARSSDIFSSEKFGCLNKGSMPHSAQM